MTLQGTWEEISVFADKLAGRQLRVTVLDANAETTPNISAQTYDVWREQADALAAHLAKTVPAHISAVDAVNEQRR